MDQDELEMARHQSEIDLVHDILRGRTHPLTADEILAVAALRGAEVDQAFRANIQTVLDNSSLVMPVADHGYAWLPRLMTGTVVRVPLFPSQLIDGHLAVSEELEQALWPTRNEALWFIDMGPVMVDLPDADPIALDYLDDGAGALEPWLFAQRPRFGDSLIVTVTDGPAQRASIRLERREERDESAIAGRNAELRAAAEAWLGATGDTFLYSLSQAMLMQGVLKASPPPDPLVMVLFDHPLWDEIYNKRYLRDFLGELTAKLARAKVDPAEEVADEEWDAALDEIWDEEEDEDDEDEADLDDSFDPTQPIDLARLPKTDSTWTFGVLRYTRPVLDEDGQPRPASVIVCVDDATGQMMFTQVVPGKLQPGIGYTLLTQLMGIAPVTHGGPQRPALVLYNSAKLLNAKERQALFALGIDTRRVNLDPLQKSLDDFLDRPDPPGLLDEPGLTAEEVGAVIAAAADFYEAAPWVPLDSEDVLAMQIDNGPERIIQVLGAGGVEYGLAVQESWEAYRLSTTHAHDNDPHRALKPTTVLLFESEQGMVAADREAFKTHGWPVPAAPDGKGHALLLVGAPGPEYPARRPNAGELREIHAALLCLTRLVRDRLPGTGQLAGVRIDETLTVPLFTGPAEVRVRFPAGVMDKGALASHAQPTNAHMVMMEPTMWDLVSKRAPSAVSAPVRKAQKLVYKARETENPARRLALAHQALTISADCADAYVLLAEEEADTRLRARDLFAQGVAAGERALGPDFFARERGHFWGLIETRAYMRARHGLGQVSWELGEHQVALDHFLAMLELNPGDNQGVRYLAAGLMLELWQTEALIALIGEHEEDGSAAWQYFGALAHFRRDGDSADARAWLTQAREANPRVIDFLLQRQRLDAEQAETISFGDRSEALAHAQEVLNFWRRTPGAVAWLRDFSK